MADREIVQNLLTRLGQSQDARLPPQLAAHFVDLDEHAPDQLLGWVRKFAELVNFYDLVDGSPAAVDSWTSFFSYPDDQAQALLDQSDGGLSPHLALLSAFVGLYEYPRQEANRLTAKHLDFFYQKVLRFEQLPPEPDHAHLLVELKKGFQPVMIGPGHTFTGKDQAGSELGYTPVRPVVVNHSKVDSLRSVYLAESASAPVRFAPAADSADGLGATLLPENPKWHAFGDPQHPIAEVGFAIASPVLRMREGTRKVTLSLQLGGLSGPVATASSFAGIFAAYLTGEKAWLGPYGLNPTVVADRLNLSATIPAEDPGVVDYVQATHGYTYAAEGPVLQVLMTSAGGIGYRELKDLTVNSAQVSVEVTGITDLRLESDAGSLNPKKSFLPFGAQPVAGVVLVDWLF